MPPRSNTSRSRASARAGFCGQDLQLAQDIGSFYADPLGFVMYVFPWGKPGTRLENHAGPDTWQIDILRLLGECVKAGMNVADALPAMVAVASGHGIGKTALLSWIILWFIATREHPQIIVTAGKQEQLSGKTWRELAKWNKLSLCGHWFHWTATKLEHALFAETWFAHAIAWSKNAPENFAGTHEEHVLVIYDEASAIDDVIWETTDGAMTTPGAMWIAFGNPTRTTGRFAQCFGKFKSMWKTRKVDSRTAKMANHALLNKWVELHGENSDFVRVRVRGEFPVHGDMQFISSEEYQAATQRNYSDDAIKDFAKVLSVDVARHGQDQSVICRRQGRKVFPLNRMRVKDLMVLAGLVAAEIDEFEPDAVFIDATGMGWGVVDRLRQMNYKNIIGVQTGESANDPVRFKRKREELWWHLREFIRAGGQLPKDPELESELTEPEYWYDDAQRFIIESKDDMRERDLASPDGADAIALSFAAPVHQRRKTAKKASWRAKLKAGGGRRSPMTSRPGVERDAIRCRTSKRCIRKRAWNFLRSLDRCPAELGSIRVHAPARPCRVLPPCPPQRAVLHGRRRAMDAGRPG